MNANFLESNPIPVKAALSMMGFIDEAYRLPLVEIQPSNREKLKAILRSLKLV
jgi:4-hydroxy-tetrahydrodipicolinate synthase